MISYMTNNEMPQSVARRLGFLAVPTHTPYQKAHTLHTDAFAFLTLHQPHNAVKACEQALAIIEGVEKPSQTLRDLRRNVKRTLARAQARVEKAA